MIGKLRGTIDSVKQDSIILDVGGVGYLVYTPLYITSKFKIGDSVSLYIHTHVQEDNISLFGFNSEEEKSAFIILQTVSGIGTRVALTILSTLTLSNLSKAIATADKDAFRKISGIGPKLAERILVELKGKTFGDNINYDNAISETTSVSSDATSALMNLGINRNEVQNIVSEIIKQDPDISLDKLIRVALQKRGSR